MSGPTADWATALAASLVTHGPLPPTSKAGLRTAFRGGTEVVIVCLANGEELEAFPLLWGGLPSEQAIPSHFLGISSSSATLRAIQQQKLVLVDAATHDREELEDWQQLHAAGINWLLVAPLGCGCGGSGDQLHTLGLKRRVVGSVVVGGHGYAPTIDGGWLWEWAQEMGCLISHASVQLMECCLELLGTTFPPPVLEQLVLNAARKTGQVDLTSMLHVALNAPRGSTTSSEQSLGSTRGGSVSPCTNNVKLAISHSSLEECLPLSPASPQSLAAQHQLRSVEMLQNKSSALGGAGNAVSPFATQAPLPLASPRSVGGGSGAARQDGADSGNSLPRPPATILLSQASRSGSTASAILRQVSMLSHVSCLLDDQQPAPSAPHDHELEGYEDILEEDRRQTLEGRPSMAPERARSSWLAPGLDQSISANTVALDEAGRLRGAAQHSTAQAAVDLTTAAAAAAAGPMAPVSQGVEPGSPQQRASGSSTVASPSMMSSCSDPPSIRVPWQRTPVLYPLTGSADAAAACPLDSPCEPCLPKSIASDSLQSSPFNSSPVGHVGDAAIKNKDRMRGGTSGRCKNGSSVDASLSKAGSFRSTGSPTPSSPICQAWDLRFIDQHVEAAYRTSVFPYMLRCDSKLGMLHLAVAAFFGGHLAVHGASANSLMSLAGCVLLAAPSIFCWLNPSWWGPHRPAGLALLRLLLALLLAAHQALAVEREARVVTWFESALGRSGGAVLCLLAVRQPLPVSLHMPLQLLCISIITAGGSLAHFWRGGGSAAASFDGQMPLPMYLAAQFLVGFSLSTLLVYRLEKQLRSSFLSTRRAAACLNGSGGTERQHLHPPSSCAVLAGQ